MYGNPVGGDAFNDAEECPLTFENQIESIEAAWSSNTLDYVRFIYSNRCSRQHGRQIERVSNVTDRFDLNPGENIDGLTVFTGTRMILNAYSPNGSLLVVGLRFHTDQQRTSNLFGSTDGTRAEETAPGFTLAYVRGQALGYVDALQFIWYSKRSVTSNAALPEH